MKKAGLLSAIISATIGAILIFSMSAFTQSQGSVSEEFHQTYSLGAGGRVSLNNINGSVRVTAWDRDEVQVDAVKWAHSQERLAEVKIIVDVTANGIRIKTEYPSSSTTWTDDEDRRHRNPATVEYTLSVPRAARIDSIELVNGDLDIEGLSGEVRGSSINGRVTAKHLTGEVKLSTVNGLLEASFDRLYESRPVSLSSVNGQVEVILPSDADAALKAGTVHGGISNDIGLPVKRGRHVGRSLAGVMGGGNARVDLSNVNGGINIRRAEDGRQPSSVINTLPGRGDRDRDHNDLDESADDQREAERAVREIERAIQETERAQRRP